MPTVGKHTGIGRLLAWDEGTGALLCDPDSGRLLCDGDIYFNQDPPKDPETDLAGELTRYWPAFWDWRQSVDSRRVSAGFGYLDAGGHDQSDAVRSWLQGLHGGTGIPASGNTGDNASSYAYASCGASDTEARIRAFTGSIGAYVHPTMQGSPVLDSFTAHYWRIPVYRTGPFAAHLARFRGQDEHVMPANVFYGGPYFVRSRSGSSDGWRYARLGVGKTFLNDGNGLDVQEHITVDLRAMGLPFASAYDGRSGSLSVQVAGTANANDPDRYICLYGTLRYHYP